jgi:hypothetical protein
LKERIIYDKVCPRKRRVVRKSKPYEIESPQHQYEQ